MNRMKIKVAVLMLAAVASSGCSIFKKGERKTPVMGEGVPVLVSEPDNAVDPATAALPMILPEPVANTEWAQDGGNASKTMGHVALGGSIGQAWAVSIGRGTSLTQRLASPAVAAGLPTASAYVPRWSLAARRGTPSTRAPAAVRPTAASARAAAGHRRTRSSVTRAHRANAA